MELRGPHEALRALLAQHARDPLRVRRGGEHERRENGGQDCEQPNSHLHLSDRVAARKRAVSAGFSGHSFGLRRAGCRGGSAGTVRRRAAARATPAPRWPGTLRPPLPAASSTGGCACAWAWSRSSSPPAPSSCCAPRRSGEERRARFERFDEDPRAAQAFVDIYDLIPHRRRRPVGPQLAVAGGAPEQLAAREGRRRPRAPRGRRSGAACTGCARRVTDDGRPVRALPAAARARRGRARGRGRTTRSRSRARCAPRDGDVALVATSRRDGTELTWPVERDGDAFAARIETAGLVRAGDSEVWDLRARRRATSGCGSGAHFDGIFDKSAVIRIRRGRPSPARPRAGCAPTTRARTGCRVRSVPISAGGGAAQAARRRARARARAARRRGPPRPACAGASSWPAWAVAAADGLLPPPARDRPPQAQRAPAPAMPGRCTSC